MPLGDRACVDSLLEEGNRKRGRGRERHNILTTSLEEQRSSGKQRGNGQSLLVT